MFFIKYESILYRNKAYYTDESKDTSLIKIHLDIELLSRSCYYY